MRNDWGHSPLCKTLEHICKEGCVDVALYLMSRGCGDDDDDDKAKLLRGACSHGKLGVVKELVEQHKFNPKSECKLIDNIFK